MTNLAGIELLFYSLFLFLLCVLATALLLGWLGYTRWKGGEFTHVRYGLTLFLAVTGLGLAIVSWIFALIFMTPSGIITRVFRPNPVLIILLLGYTAPAILGGYTLWKVRTSMKRFGSDGESNVT